MASSNNVSELDDLMFLIGDDESAIKTDNNRFAVDDFDNMIEGISCPRADIQTIPKTSPNKNQKLCNPPVVQAQEHSCILQDDTSHMPHIGTMMKAVHMEVQENARISTYMQPVDRSNSSLMTNIKIPPKKKRKKSSLKKHEIIDSVFRDRSSFLGSVGEEINNGCINAGSSVTANENDFLSGNDSSSSGSFNLAEIFLGETDRSGAAHAYKSAGVHANREQSILDYSKICGTDKAISFNNVEVQSDEGLATLKSNQVITNPMPMLINDSIGTSTNISLQESHPHRFTYYPYGRSEPLPISGSMQNSNQRQKDNKNNDAIKLLSSSSPISNFSSNESHNPNEAFTIKGTKKSSVTIINNNFEHLRRSDQDNESNDRNRIEGISSTHAYYNMTGTNGIPLSNKAEPLSTEQKGKSYVFRKPHHLDVKPYSKIPTSVSILEAAKKKNQFGFGRGHIVPSVPQPPPPSKVVVNGATHPTSMVSLQSNSITNDLTMTNTMKKTDVIHMPAAFVPMSKIARELESAPISKTIAYERKKQRAKDGRIRLNDAIEKLSVSISVAGSQTKRRLDHQTDYHASLVKVMESCVCTVQETKKWDRPSFVNSAAILIQQLNDQCDALEREVKRVKSNANCTSLISLKNNKYDTASNDEPAISHSNGVNSFESSKIPQTINESKNDQNAVEWCEAINNSATDKFNIRSFSKKVHRKPGEDFFQVYFSNQDTILHVISTFLDPRSLARCLCVAKYWKYIEQFKNNETWTNLCINRFGREQVEQWRKGVQSEIVDDKNLYRQMHEAKVAPRCYLQGDLSLGHGTTKGVSAWASMSTRSNGETLRSVRTFPEANARNKYSSMQRSTEHPPPKAEEEGEYLSLPVVELRIVIQNTGNDDVIVPEQTLSVDACTRRKKAEMTEVKSDERLFKSFFNLDGTSASKVVHSNKGNNAMLREEEIVRLRLFDSVVLVAHIFARGCSTTSKFCAKANFTKVLVRINGTTMPVCIPFEKSTNDSNNTNINGNDVSQKK